MRLSSKTLALAVSRQGIAAAEVTASRGRYTLERAAVMPLGAEVTWEEPARVGAALKEFLRAGGFTARRCVIGLEAAALASKEKRLPEAALANLTDILRLAAEQDFASDEQELVFDYTATSDGRGTTALLVAAPRRVVEQVTAAAAAAGLAVTAVTASAIALAQATGGAAADGQRLVVSLGEGACELVVQSGGAARLMRRLSGPAPAALEAELQRVMASNGPEGPGGATELAVWNAAGVSEAALREMGGRLGATTRVCRFPADLGLEGQGPAGAGVAAAAAMGAAAVRGQAGGLDFLHSRLTPRAPRRVGKVAAWSAAAAALALGAVVWLVLDWRSSRGAIEEMEGRLADLGPKVKKADEVIHRVSFTRGWFDERLPMLDGLRGVTLAYPQEGKIWATSLAVREDMTAALSGKASGRVAVLELLDQLRASAAFADVKLQYTRQAERSSQDVSFVINIRYAGGK